MTPKNSPQPKVAEPPSVQASPGSPASAWRRAVGRIASSLRAMMRRPPALADAEVTASDTTAPPHRWRTWHIAVAAGAASVLAAAAGAWWWVSSTRTGAPPARSAPEAKARATGPEPTTATRAASANATSPAAPLTPSATASAPIGAIAPDIRPRLAEPAARGASTHFALVSPPIASEAEARALLARLRDATARIRHPTATETSIDRTPEGWRVAWWPFNGDKPAANARSAMAGRGIALEVVDF